MTIAANKQRLWFIVLLMLGVLICTPKLLRPIRIKKKGCVVVAEWLKANTAPTDIVAVPDIRISFYAEREGFTGSYQNLPSRTKFVVRIIQGQNDISGYPENMKEEYSVGLSMKKKGSRIVVYRATP